MYFNKRFVQRNLAPNYAKIKTQRLPHQAECV